MLDTVAMVRQKLCYAMQKYIWGRLEAKRWEKYFRTIPPQNVHTSFSSNDSLFEQNTVGWMIRFIGISHVAFGHKKNVLELLPLIRNPKSGTYYHHVFLLRYTNNIIFREKKHVHFQINNKIKRGGHGECLGGPFSVVHVCLYTSQYAVFMHMFGTIHSVAHKNSIS